MFKKELIVGILGTALAVTLAVYYGFQYKSVTTGLNSATAALGSAKIQVVLSLTEVAKHNLAADCWVIIRNKVYDVTAYSNSHPGGAGRITSFCGQDLTNAFLSRPHSTMADKLHASMFLGSVNAKITAQDVSNIKNTPLTNGSGAGLKYEDD